MSLRRTGIFLLTATFRTTALLAVIHFLCFFLSQQTTLGATPEQPAGGGTKNPLLDLNNPGVQQTRAIPAEPTNVVRSFSAQGLVKEIPAGGRTVVISHEAIPGFMPGMTMEFTVRDSTLLRGLRAGDRVTFMVRANQEESWIDDIQPSGTSDLPAPRPMKPVTALAHVAQLKPGDLLPDAELLDEDGSKIKLSDFRGKAVAFTFIFTRCPLPDFCPRMNARFGQARALLLEKPQGPTNWLLLSISFDLDFDQPAVLKSYALNYRGQNSDHWRFASASTDVLNGMKEQLDFHFTKDGGSFAHNLRTVVLDPNGRVYRQFDGNRWQAKELADALFQAASGESH